MLRGVKRVCMVQLSAMMSLLSFAWRTRGSAQVQCLVQGRTDVHGSSWILWRLLASPELLPSVTKAFGAALESGLAHHWHISCLGTILPTSVLVVRRCCSHRGLQVPKILPAFLVWPKQTRIPGTAALIEKTWDTNGKSPFLWVQFRGRLLE